MARLYNDAGIANSLFNACELQIRKNWGKLLLNSHHEPNGQDGQCNGR